MPSSGVSPPGVPTHFPHNPRLQATVIDLAWVPSDQNPDLYETRVTPEERGTSNHTILHVYIPTGARSYAGAPSIAAKSEEEQVFISSILDSVHLALPTDIALHSVDELNAAVDSLFAHQ
ncbi:hypothetical protein OH76DRAFT_1424196 [Lentinus brumalis]|uniref:Uncharacterized protein n=1 Tax=Lentinus brumalis TaxID=2498619 RepID=A0A371CH51_9APHY|nr:hypothetical protein OH76DRAFT_1424196 [Polyporus brumalis]